MFKIKAIVETIEFLPSWVVISGRCIKLRHVIYGCEACIAAVNFARATTSETGSFYQPAADGRDPDLDFLIRA
jgi:hypothetical protein